MLTEQYDPDLQKALVRRLLIITAGEAALAARLRHVLQQIGYSVIVLQYSQGMEFPQARAVLFTPGLRREDLRTAIQELRERLSERIPVLVLCRAREKAAAILEAEATDVIPLPTTDRVLQLRVERAIEHEENSKDPFILLTSLEKKIAKAQLLLFSQGVAANPRRERWGCLQW